MRSMGKAAVVGWGGGQSSSMWGGEWQGSGVRGGVWGGEKGS